MELIGNHLQIFVSLLVILAAAAVALVCDLLKRNNEHLRELNVELRVRREEESRRAASALTVAPAIAPVTTSPSLELPALAGAVEDRMVRASAEPALERAAEITSRRGRRAAAPDAVPAAATADVQPGASIAEARMLAREFMGRAVARAGEAKPAAPAATTIRQPEVVAEVVRESRSERSSVPSTINLPRKNWDVLLSRKQPANVNTHEAPAQNTRLAELIPFESIPQPNADLVVPEGLHEGMMLARILNVEKAVRGLVVVIGINDFNSRREASGELGAQTLVGSLTDHLRSMLRAGDFACQSSQDEFVMICPNERNMAAQRRLSDIAESLWDFQLRSVGTAQILFSWGGVEAKGEPLTDVLSTAADRMHETRRSRRSLTMETPLHRKAV